jgi:RimJ/RimL family protein N-acetyltransferase
MAGDATRRAFMTDLFTGRLVRLGAFNPEEVGTSFSKWSRDSEYWRLMASEASRLVSARDATRYFEKEVENPSPAMYFFGVRTLAVDKLIGEIVLEVTGWNSRDAFAGLSIGDRENWGRGYGTEMVSLLLGFAFKEVNLHRVSLTVFEYNPRAVRVYEKAGFRHEGRCRQVLHREGRRWDMLFMGILREDWLKQNMEGLS